MTRPMTLIACLVASCALLGACSSAPAERLDYTAVILEAATRGVPQVVSTPCKGASPSFMARWTIPVYEFPNGARGRATHLRAVVELAEDCPDEDAPVVQED
jgi:hypothetical protein